MKTVTWLHLSDLHAFSPNYDWEAPNILHSLINDLKEMQKTYGLQPNLLFFTGDLAFGHRSPEGNGNISKQFDEAERFLTSVRTVFKERIMVENTFIIPGNHDVNRGDVTPDQTDWLDKQEKLDAITEAQASANKQWLRYMERLQHYREFLEKYRYAHLLSEPELAKRLIYRAVREINGVRIGVSGFNSAWSCGRDREKEKGKLWLGGDYQEGMLSRFNDNIDFKIALIHHPPNWFVEQENPLWDRKIEKYYQFLLHGHEHSTWVAPNNRGFTRIAAHACYDGTEHKNGYNFVRLDFEKGTGEVWLRDYRAERGWIPCNFAGNTNNDGLWQLEHLDWMKLKVQDETDISKHDSEITTQKYNKTLDYSKKQLIEMPSDIFSVSDLEFLNLSNNNLTELPSEIGLLTNLRELYLNNNLLSTLPSEISNLEKLQVLDVANNNLTSLPPEIEQMPNLKKLSLSGNRLSMLSGEIIQ